MAILDTVKKIIPYIKTATGYVLCRLSSQAVEMDDGTVLQDKIESMDTAINGKAPSSHTHPVSQVTGLTGSRALVSDSSGHPAVSAVTSTELGYLDGAKSNIQSQINTLNSNLSGLNGNIRITRENSYLSTYVVIIKRGNMATMSYSGDFVGGTPTGDLGILFNLPAGFTPVTNVLTFTGPNTNVQIEILPSGNVYAYNYGDAISAAKTARFTLTYVTA